MAAVFAQLIVEGESHGVHALVVPLRDEHGSVLPGIAIEDGGEKLASTASTTARSGFAMCASRARRS